MRMIYRGALTCLLAEADSPLLCRHFCGCVVRLVIEKVVERGRNESLAKDFEWACLAMGKGGIKKSRAAQLSSNLGFVGYFQR